MELYVHIPFCVQKCLYCDFFSLPAAGAVQDRYFETLKQEIRESPDLKEPVTSVFFGGGTPSLVQAEQIAVIRALLSAKFNIRPEAEITLEANPGTLTREKLAVYKEAGFSRLSLGLQAADDGVLKSLGRIHDFNTFLKSYHLAREAGFSNINIDLISGIPGVGAEDFRKGLEKTLRLRPEHLSVYSLIIAENTPFYALYGPEGSLKDRVLSEEEDREQVRLTQMLMKEAGYRQYELSNFALPGYECRHNIGYWTGVSYLGFGAAAASFVYTDEAGMRAVRRKNAESLDYRERPFEEEEKLEKEDLMAEFMILGLRMTEGISDDVFRSRFGRSFFDCYEDIIRRYMDFGVLKRDGERLSLTAYGQDVSNVLFEEFI